MPSASERGPDGAAPGCGGDGVPRCPHDAFCLRHGLPEAIPGRWCAVKQATGNLWTFPADARCITTNGATRQDGQAVMGRGVAAPAKERWALLPAVRGGALRQHGNHVQLLMSPETIQPPFDDMAHILAF